MDPEQNRSLQRFSLLPSRSRLSVFHRDRKPTFQTRPRNNDGKTIFLLLSSAHRASQTVQSSNRPDPRLPGGQTATLLQHNYLSLPMYLDSDLPLVRKDSFSPARGSGSGSQEALPPPVRELLLPVWPHASAPHSVSGAAVRTSCERSKMQLQVERSVLGSGGPGSHLKLGTCRVSRSTEDHLYSEYDLRMCGTKRTMINNLMVYYNMLRYDPPKSRGPIRRMAPSACYFNRFVYSYKVGYSPKVQRRKVLKKMKNAAKFVLTPRNETDSTSWTIEPKVKSKPSSNKKKRTATTRGIPEITTGRIERKQQPEEVVGVQVGEEEGDGRWVKGSSLVEANEKVSELQAIFEDIFDFD
ncbi:LOW QUALITY PROTEIN: zona pellucida sperm-binding protein 3d.2 [Anableps anableps]